MRAIANYTKVLIANRGEIAIRIARSAAELGLETVAVYAMDDAQALHRKATDSDYALPGSGAVAYLDMDAVVAAARATGCDAIHPGYGFLSENAEFARLCERHGLLFIGPQPQTLELLGDKARARAAARAVDIPVPRGTDGSASLEETAAFMDSLGTGGMVMVKAIAGGGGRGMRIVRHPAALAEAYARCRSEAAKAFGRDEVYVEELVRDARHIEVQVLGDGHRAAHLGERDCSVQIRHQKVIEITPSPTLMPELRQRMTQAAVRMAESVALRGLCTFEFLVAMQGDRWAFIEANPRIQVEHTITEEVNGVDLVRAQFQLADGRSLDDLDLPEVFPLRGHAIQLRINLASLDPSDGALTTCDFPGGPGIRVDTCAYRGYRPSAGFDPLLAKIIVHSPQPSFEAVVRRAYRALAECRISGVETNIHFLQNVLQHPAFAQGRISTSFVEDHIEELSYRADSTHPRRFFVDSGAVDKPRSETPLADDGDPEVVKAPMRGAVIEVSCRVGARVHAGQPVAVIDAMKMEHEIAAPHAGVVSEVWIEAGAVVSKDAPLMRIEAAEVEGGIFEATDTGAPGRMRPDLAEAIGRYKRTLDEARPAAKAKRHKTGLRTARENLNDLCDPDSFAEYGALAVAGQRSRQTYDELLDTSPADGFIYGLATVNRHLFGAERSRCMVAAYDYTVYAGTQGYIAHKKHDRMFHIAERARLPVIVFAEGGGGRPLDTDNIGGVNLANPTWWHFGRLSGLVPTVGIAAGRCFAGNAALLGCCDVVVATRGATIGMGGPAMIEGAGLGVVAPDDVGPAPMHARQGVVDVLVEDEAQAVLVAKRYLSYFQGTLGDWSCGDQAQLRDAIPERRTRAYDVRSIIETLADTSSVLELRREFGQAAVTALVRLEGRPVGLIANDPKHQAGALGANESDKIARFMQLCDAFDLPVVSLCDTPGIMVGPDAERTAQVRHAARLFVTGANLSVPMFTVVLRKAYGLGAMTMAGGSFHMSSIFTVSWPTGEFGSMGLEGQIRLGYRNELAAIADPQQRERRYRELVEGMYERGKALNVAPFLSIDSVIDPAQTREWLLRGLRSMPTPEHPRERRRPKLDTW